MTKQEIIIEAADRIGTRPEWLDALINFETRGTYDPLIRNPKSSAKGLIQFIDASAQDMGFNDSLSLVNTFNTFESQMFNAVIPYFELKARQNGIKSYMTKQALYMAVFYPDYWDKSIVKPFPAHVREVNPGIDTPADYIRYVDQRVKQSNLVLPESKEQLSAGNPPIPPLLVLAAAGVGAYLITRYMQ